VRGSAYPPIAKWQIPQAAIDATLAAVAPAGRSGRESGVFWLGSRERVSVVCAVVRLNGPGVVEAVGRWVVSPEAYGVVGRLARARELVLLGSAHTHGVGVPVKLSGTDRRHGTRVPDILAVVIGNDGADRNPARWSWNTFKDAEFLELDDRARRERITITGASVTLWQASATGSAVWSGVGV
jgi:hypothetical protein